MVHCNSQFNKIAEGPLVYFLFFIDDVIDVKVSLFSPLKGEKNCKKIT